MTILEVLVGSLAVLLILVLIFFKWSFTYWQRRGVPYIPNPTIPFGNISDLIKQKQSLFDVTKNNYDELKSKNHKHGGLYFFSKAMWMPVDLDLIRSVMIKDFAHFVNHGNYINEKVDPLTGNLFFLEDDKWRHTRAALTHSFTSGKIKMIFQLMAKIADNLEKIIEDSAVNKETIDIHDYLSRFVMDVIASSAFGLEINTIDNPEESFRKYGKMALEHTGYEALRDLVAFLLPRKLLSAFNFKQFKPKVEEFFTGTVKNVVEYREKNNIERKDLLQLLMQLKNTGKPMDFGQTKNDSKDQTLLKLSINEIAAQAFLFFVAGFETSSTTATFALFELSLNPDIQDKVRREIKDVLEKYDGELTYEGCNEMTYLEQVIKETLRKYPPVSTGTRICTKDYPVPESDVVIEKGTPVIIPIAGVHYDPDIYPEPHKFDPDRFAENKKIIPNNAFLPFGEGPRICIGMRLGLIQSKVAMITVLKNHRVALNKKRTIFPIEFESRAQVTNARGGIWLDIISE